MAAPTTSTPSPSDQQPTGGQLKRRRLVERLRKEGRAYGQTPMGFRVVGKRGSRRLVPDDHQRRRMRLVAEWRDRHGMSWDQISDALEEYVARLEDRKPLSRGFRRGTTKKTAWRMYRAFKQLEVGEPQVTHRRCKTCQRSLLLNQFAPNGQVCVTCRITAPLKAFDERLAVTAADLIGRTRNQDKPLPPSRAEIGHRIEGVIRNVLRLAKRNPRASELAESIEALVRALERDLATNVPAEAMGQAQLEQALCRRIRREIRPLLLEVQAELAMLGAIDSIDEVES